MVFLRVLVFTSFFKGLLQSSASANFESPEKRTRTSAALQEYIGLSLDKVRKVEAENVESKFGPDEEVENIGNFKQTNPIIGSNDPFGINFDSSQIYAPIFGGMIYSGLRIKI